MKNRSFKSLQECRELPGTKLTVCGIIFASVALTMLLVAVPLAGAQDLVGEAGSAYAQGDYKKAAELAEEYIKRSGDTSSRQGIEASFYVAYYDYVQGNYEKAITVFLKVSASKAVVSLPAQALIYLADAYLRVGDNLAKETDEAAKARRKEAYENAERNFKQYLTLYRDGAQRNEAALGLAKAYAALERFTDSLSVIDSVVKSLTKPSPSEEELAELVQAYNIKASVSKNYREALIKAGRQEEADKFFSDVKQELVAFFEKQKLSDAAIANNVAFAIGDLLTSINNFTDAIDFYHLVSPAGEILRTLEEKIKRIEIERRLRVMAARDPGEARRIDSYYNRYLNQAKKDIRDVKAKPDPIISALERIAYCYLALKRYHEANIITKHLLNFTKSEDRKAALKLAVFSALGVAAPDEAAQLLQNYEKEFKVGDPELDSVAFYIGQYYEAAGKFDQALEYYEKSARDYPDGRQSLPNLLQLAIALSRAGRHKEALAHFESYSGKAPPKTENEHYLYFRAKTELALGRWNDAVEHLRAVKQRFPGFAAMDDVVFNLSVGLVRSNRAQEAVAELTAYLNDPRTQNSPARPNLYYQLGTVYRGMGRIPEAIKTFEEVSRISANPLKAYAQIEIAKCYSNDRAKMEEILGKLFESKDAPPDVLAEAHFELAARYQQDAMWDKAAAQYQIVVDNFADSKKAAEAQLNVAKCTYAPVKGLSRADEQRQQWISGVERAIKEVEKLLAKYPDSSQVLPALAFLSQLQTLRLDEKITSEVAIEDYFRGLAKRFAANQLLQSRLIFALGDTFYQSRTIEPATREERALKFYTEAYGITKDVLGTLRDFTRFGSLLVQNNQLDRAAGLFSRLLDFHRKFDDPRDQQLAPYEANWWLGYIHFQNKDWERAVEHLNQLNEAPWSPRYSEAQYYLALIAENEAYEAPEKTAAALARATEEEARAIAEEKAAIEAERRASDELAKAIAEEAKAETPEAKEAATKAKNAAIAARDAALQDRARAISTLAEARRAKAEAQKGHKSLHDALAEVVEQYTKIARQRGPTNVRAKAMLRIGYIYKTLSEKPLQPPNPAKLSEWRKLAITRFRQLDVLYETERELCAEALYQAGSLLELDGDRALAVEAYQRALAKAPESEWGRKARERLQQLGASETPPKKA